MSLVKSNLLQHDGFDTLGPYADPIRKIPDGSQIELIRQQIPMPMETKETAARPAPDRGA
jgi:hypothetical protein